MLQPKAKGLVCLAASLLLVMASRAQEINLSVRETGEQINLVWTHPSDSISRNFTVERSADGVHFETIGEIPGQTQCEKTCRLYFTDKIPVNGMNYYRVVVRTDTGITQSSRVATEDFTSTRKPFKVLTSGSRITVQCRQPIDRILVWTSSGKRLVEKNDLNNANYSFTASGSDSFVFLMLELADGSRFTEKIGIR